MPAISEAEKETLKKVRQTLKANNVLVFPTAPAAAAGAAPPVRTRSEDGRGDSPAAATPRPRPHAEVPIPERGVSLAWLINLARSLQQAGVPEDITTHDMVTKMLLPLCRSRVPNPLCSDSLDSRAAMQQRPASDCRQSRIAPNSSCLLSSPRALQGSIRMAAASKALFCSPLRSPRQSGGGVSGFLKQLVKPRDPVQGGVGKLRDLLPSGTLKHRERELLPGGTGRQRELAPSSPTKQQQQQQEAEEDSDEEEPSAPELDVEALAGGRSAPNLRPVFQRYVVKVQPLWDLLPSSSCGRPDYYVIHAWQAGFQDLIKALSNRLNPPPELGQAPRAPLDPAAVFVWLDFAVVPHSDVLGQSLEIDTVKESILKARSGTLVILDPGLLLLGRTWTLLEMFLAIYHQPMGKLELVFPRELELDLAWQIHSKLANLDIAHTESSRPEDKLCIIRVIKNHVGSKRAAQTLQETLMRSVRATLRWGSLEQLAVYFALLLKEREFSVLACVLSSIPELATDDKALDEIREIFGIYDSDGSGELDIDEFIQVLDAAGFDEAEARKIFDQVNADQGDGVGFGEFEAWWVDSQKQHFLRARRAQKELSFDELCSRMEEFIKHLNRKQLTQYTDFFSEWLDKLRSGTVVSMKQKLLLPPTKGDMVDLADQVSWKLHACDYKGTIATLHVFLQHNGDCLDMNVDDIPRDSSSEIETLRTLLKLLDLVLGLLRWYPGKSHHAEHFFLVSERIESKVRAYDGQEGDAEQTAARPGRGKKRMGKVVNTKGMYGIISNMVHLKYGDDRAMNTALIQEAGTALSRWMASNRDGKKGSSGVSSLTHDYLGSTNKPGQGGRGLLPAMGPPRPYGGAGDMSPSPNKVKLPAI